MVKEGIQKFSDKPQDYILFCVFRLQCVFVRLWSDGVRQILHNDGVSTRPWHHSKVDFIVSAGFVIPLQWIT